MRWLNDDSAVRIYCSENCGSVNAFFFLVTVGDEGCGLTKFYYASCGLALLMECASCYDLLLVHVAGASRPISYDTIPCIESKSVIYLGFTSCGLVQGQGYLEQRGAALIQRHLTVILLDGMRERHHVDIMNRVEVL